MDAPKAPKAPDPKVTAAADQNNNINTAIAQTAMNNVNEYSPYGTVTYDVTGTERVKDATGNWIDIPTYSRTTELSDAEQQKLDLQNQLSFQAGDIANQQLDQLQGALSTPLNYDGIPEAPDGDSEYYRGLLYERLNPQIERDRNRLDTQLANQGITPGTEAYKRAIEQSERNINDARIGAELASGQYADQEIARQLGLRNQAIQERSALRSQPINEISALMSQSQVNTPQFQSFRSGNIQPTDVGGLINNNYNQQLANYQNQLNQQNAMFGGLFGLGGKLIGGGLF